MRIWRPVRKMVVWNGVRLSRFELVGRGYSWNVNWEDNFLNKEMYEMVCSREDGAGGGCVKQWANLDMSEVEEGVCEIRIGRTVVIEKVDMKWYAAVVKICWKTNDLQFILPTWQLSFFPSLFFKLKCPKETDVLIHFYLFHLSL